MLVGVRLDEMSEEISQPEKVAEPSNGIVFLYERYCEYVFSLG